MDQPSFTPLRAGLLIILGILITGSLFFRFWPGTYDIPSGKSAQVASTQSGITPMQFWKEIRKQELHYQVIDLRNSSDFMAGHIEGAVNIPKEYILKKKNIRLLKKNPSILYGYHEADAHQCALLLQMIGIDAQPVNSHYTHLLRSKSETGNASVLNFSEEKARYPYRQFFKAFEPKLKEPVEVKVPLPKPGGC